MILPKRWSRIPRVAFLGTAVWLLGGGWEPQEIGSTPRWTITRVSHTTGTDPALDDPEAILTRSGYVGDFSCGRRGCHGDVVALEINGGEWTRYARNDPHAHAYDTLDSSRSQRIFHAWNHTANRPYQRGDCLGCHALPEAPVDLSPEAHRSWFGGGIGCESCHGPARNWLVPHARPQHKDHERFKPRPLHPARLQAESCLGCHVGDATRQVDHDLIAAGHPRLHFDFAGDRHDWPTHWRPTLDQDRRPLRDAMVGRLVALDAALNLLMARADSTNPRWPELSEYNCFSCHTNLAGLPAFTLSLSDRTKSRRRPGQLDWGSWYASSLLWDAETTFLDVEETLKALREQMESDDPNPDAIRGHVREARSAIANLLKTMDADPFGTSFDSVALIRDHLNQARRLLDPGQAQGDRIRARDWDRLARLYLNLATLGDDARATSRVIAVEDAADLESLLDRLVEFLAFPQGYDSPRMSPLPLRADAPAGPN